MRSSQIRSSRASRSAAVPAALEERTLNIQHRTLNIEEMPQSRALWTLEVRCWLFDVSPFKCRRDGYAPADAHGAYQRAIRKLPCICDASVGSIVIVAFSNTTNCSEP